LTAVRRQLRLVTPVRERVLGPDHPDTVATRRAAALLSVQCPVQAPRVVEATTSACQALWET
jgi:hypothetical protein